MSSVDRLVWPRPRLAEAIEALGRAAGLAPGRIEAPPLPAEARGETLGRWVEAAASFLGMEAEPIEASMRELPALVRGAGPALLALAGGDGFLALLRARGAHALLLGPAGTLERVRLGDLAIALRRTHEEAVAPEIDGLLERVGARDRRRRRARRALLEERLGTGAAVAGFLLRLSPGASLLAGARQARLGRRLLLLMTAHTAQHAAWLGAWWAIGRSVFEGRLDPGWMLAWALLLMTLVPFRLLATHAAARLALGAGALLKQRLLMGALALEPEQLRRHGAGQLLARVIESEAVESLAMSGGLLAVLAGIELVVATAVLAAGAGGVIHGGLLVAWIALLVALAIRRFRSRRSWTEARLELTDDLVERMVGHRTRLAQQLPELWHDGEDQALDRYLERSFRLDRAETRLAALAARGWLVLGVAGLAPAFVLGPAGPAALAVGLGGVLLAARALARLAAGLAQLTGSVIAGRAVAPLYHAAARAEPAGPPGLAVAADPGAAPGSDLLEARGLTFTYAGRADPVLRDATLTVRMGERLLLEGASGGGKSTLASLLAGLRSPSSGLLLAGGFDRHTLGRDGWRRRVAAAPQFHENHVLLGPLAFNLLMGRRWPPRREDLREAEEVCRALDLGPLIDRMPGGLLQMVGETGWQLSHGERSRLYLARALLQGADVVVLDESFAALDPETLERSLRAVLARTRSLLVIAHP
jgi:ATP-binding cassette subfamily B protein